MPTPSPTEALRELREAALQFRDAVYRADPSLRVTRELEVRLGDALLIAEQVIAAAD